MDHIQWALSRLKKVTRTQFEVTVESYIISLIRRHPVGIDNLNRKENLTSHDEFLMDITIV